MRLQHNDDHASSARLFDRLRLGVLRGPRLVAGQQRMRANLPLFGTDRHRCPVRHDPDALRPSAAAPTATAAAQLHGRVRVALDSQLRAVASHR